MSYTPVFTNASKVQAYIQVTISETSIPSSSQVNDFIKEIEYQVLDKNLGSTLVQNKYIDVPEASSKTDPSLWTYSARSGQLKLGMKNGMIVPIINIGAPIISVTSLYKNDNEPDVAPEWEELTQWTGSGVSNFMVLKSGSDQLGYALWIYDDEPNPGPNRLKISYGTGWAVDSVILGDYCTYGAAIKALMSRMATNEPDGLSMLESERLGSFVPNQYETRIKLFQNEMRRIERDHFPKNHETIGVMF